MKYSKTGIPCGIFLPKPSALIRRAIIYEKNLQGKSIRDEESYETLDIIFADKVFDLGFYYNIGKYRGTMSTKFKGGDTTFASFYAEQEEAAKLELKKINNLYKGLLDE